MCVRESKRERGERERLFFIPKSYVTTTNTLVSQQHALFLHQVYFDTGYIDQTVSIHPFTSSSLTCYYVSFREQDKNNISVVILLVLYTTHYPTF